jgi:phage gpG-like protein
MTQTINDPSEFVPLLTDLQNQVDGMSLETVLQESLQDIAEYEAGMFAGEFASDLSPWAPLAVSTVKRKKHDRILIDTGALRESLVHIGGAGNIASATERGLIFGTEVPYAGFLQDGTSKMPARPPVGVSEETLDKLCDRIADDTVKQLAASGRL